MSYASSATDSGDEDFTAPPTPSLPDIDGVQETFRTHRKTTFSFGDITTQLPPRKNEYDYDPLSPNKIRILELKKGKGNQDTECSLLRMTLPRKAMPKY
jgi:hypothetical protein